MQQNDDRSPLRSVQPRGLRQEVADILREAILSGQWPPGQRLVEATLAEELGVGRTPVREALSQLEQQGLVKIVPNQGTSVVEPNPEESYQVLMLRVFLETLAARLAAIRGDVESLRKMAHIVRQMAALSADTDAPLEEISQEMFVLDRQFHQHLMEASGSAALRRIWSMVNAYIWFTMLASGEHRGRPWPPWKHAYPDRQSTQAEVRDHQAVLDAIYSGDMERIEETILYHNAVSLPTSGLDESILAALRRPIPGLQPLAVASQREAGEGSQRDTVG